MVREFSSVGLEHLLDMQEVAGSNPVAPTRELFFYKVASCGVIVWTFHSKILGWRVL